ncbi:MAG: SET domain-containing protein [Legionellaceae bacterium]|nr:SET domain-containing protein [Legionellaceae bacterium]
MQSIEETQKKRKTSLTVNYLTARGEIQHLSNEQACEKFNMVSWTNALVSTDGEENIPLNHQVHNHIDKSLLAQTKMAIVDISINGSVCQGVIATEVIEPGTTIIYSSQLLDPDLVKTRKNDPYMVDLSTPVSAKDFGNIARFLNHAPSQEIVDTILTFNSPEDKDNLACANFTTEKVITESVEYFVLKANRYIHPGEALLWDYGLDYFLYIDSPLALFNKQGDVIDPSSYRFDHKMYVKPHKKELSLSCDFYQLMETNSFVLIPSRESKLSCDIMISAEYFRKVIMANPEILYNYHLVFPLPKGSNEYIKYVSTYDRFSITNEACDYLNKMIINDILSKPLQRRDINHQIMHDKDAEHDLLAPKECVFLCLQNQDLTYMDNCSLVSILGKLENNGIRAFIDDSEEDHKLYIMQIDLFKYFPSLPIPKRATKQSPLLINSMLRYKDDGDSSNSSDHQDDEGFIPLGQDDDDGYDVKMAF